MVCECGHDKIFHQFIEKDDGECLLGECTAKVRKKVGKHFVRKSCLCLKYKGRGVVDYE